MSQSKKYEWRFFCKHIEQGRAKSKRWCKILQNNLGRESTLKVFRQVRLRFGFFVRAECALRFDIFFGLRCAHQVVVVSPTLDVYRYSNFLARSCLFWFLILLSRIYGVIRARRRDSSAAHSVLMFSRISLLILHICIAIPPRESTK